ncbi:MAG: hypothetical protein WBW89_17200 [Candidatus Cybelea sp.]
MRLSLIRTSAYATVAAIVLAACSGNGAIPSTQSAVAPQSAIAPQSAAPQSAIAPESALAPATLGDNMSPLGDDMSPLGLVTCAKSPPQYEWIFKGACTGFNLKSTGGTFALGQYANITVTGSIGKNSAKGEVHVILVDAVNKNDDILKNKGKTFPPYKARGTTVVYAEASNQTTQTIKPIAAQGKAVIEYVITDAKGFPGKTCGAAVYGKQPNGKEGWTAFTGTYPVKGKTVTIAVFVAPAHFELPPKGTPLYFGINCY